MTVEERPESAERPVIREIPRDGGLPTARPDVAIVVVYRDGQPDVLGSDRLRWLLLF